MTHEVIIIGAGISGIGAGNELMRRGIDNFCIIEAEDCAGGRIKTVGDEEGGFLDLGAQWVHGEAPDNAVHLAIHEADLVDTETDQIDGGGDFFSEFAQKLTNDDKLAKALECFEGLNVDILKETFHHCHDNVGGFFYSKFQEFLLSVKDPVDRHMYSCYYNWMIRWERVDNACHSMNKISAARWQDYKFCRGIRNIPPKRGMISVFSKIAQTVRQKIHLNTEVTRIDVNQMAGTSITEMYNTHLRPVTVYCRNGITYKCKHVIVTCSIGFLKQNLTMFSPPLPEKLENAIRLHGYGNIGKIFLEFDTKWWNWKDGSLQLVWTDDLPQFDDPAQKSNHWIKAVCGFNEAYGRKNTLLAWIGGEECSVMEHLPLDEVSYELVKLLRQFTGKLDIPKPINIFRSEFSANKFFNGGYSHPISDNDNENIIDTLNVPIYGQYSSDPVKMPSLVLAGEANSKNYYSTMHGALENGTQQAGIYCDWREKYFPLKSVL